MFKYFFKVTNVFQEGDYVIVHSDKHEDREYANGEIVELRTPAGTVISTKSTEVFYDPPDDRPLALAFHGLKKSDIPVGTEVWINEERPTRKPSRHYEEMKMPEQRRHSA